MLLNDLVALLEELPAKLAGGWAAWLFVGLLLSVWQRREGRRLVVHAGPTRQESSPRPYTGVRASARSAPVPPSASDAFGELAALLEQQPGTHRTPGESSPVLSEQPTRPLAGPQSLP